MVQEPHSDEGHDVCRSPGGDVLSALVPLRPGGLGVLAA